jgi:hypothetical protein
MCESDSRTQARISFHASGECNSAAIDFLKESHGNAGMRGGGGTNFTLDMYLEPALVLSVDLHQGPEEHSPPEACTIAPPLYEQHSGNSLARMVDSFLDVLSVECTNRQRSFPRDRACWLPHIRLPNLAPDESMAFPRMALVRLLDPPSVGNGGRSGQIYLSGVLWK